MIAIPSYGKCVQVIRSCTTLEQLEVARNYVSLYERARISNDNVYSGMTYWLLLDHLREQKRQIKHGSVVERDTR